MEETTNAVDWWARGIGSAGLSIALLSLGWTVYHAVVRDRAKLAISTSINVLGLGGVTTLTCVGADVANVGRRPITLVGCSLDIGGKLSLAYTGGLALKDPFLGTHVDESHKMPRRLEEGESHRFYFPVETLRAALAEHPSRLLRQVVVRDGANHKWQENIPKGVSSFVAPEGVGSDKAGAPDRTPGD